ncbi:hypothetical protein [Aquimonas voraii]|uniref:DUF86 domain-containing protein n=1 Tax=Aquimonas voraii TaxID=265719 RepID=A0A1G7AJ57_9GAMM|nr:hypothetical protein [Aquimonas voraii]SDE14812.1 hypothetical protein SAMN04488509_1296 [Aquimonas voraii]
MDIPPQPEGFSELCERVGLAMMLGQKVQYALAGYFATHSRVRKQVNLEDAKAQMEKHLSKAMGHVIGAIEESDSLPEVVWEKVKAFQDERNWLVHDFDEEATPFLSRGERIPEYLARMEEIARSAVELMELLDAEGSKLVPGVVT